MIMFYVFFYMIVDWTANETHCHTRLRNGFYGDDLCYIFYKVMCSLRKFVDQKFEL